MQTGIKRLGNILPTSTRENPNQGRVYDTGGIAPAITSGGGYCTLHILNVRLAELRISHTRQVNYGEEECKAAVMYAPRLHLKAWEFAVLKKLFGGAGRYAA